MSEDYLLRECSDPDPATRSEALENLAYRDGPAAAKHLRTALARDRDERVRLKALELLWGLGGNDARRAVSQAFGDSSAVVQQKAMDLPQERNRIRLAARIDIDRWSRQCLEGTPGERVEAAECLSKAFVRLTDLPPQFEDRLVERWASGCPTMRSAMAGFMLNDVAALDLPGNLATVGPVIASVALNTDQQTAAKPTAQAQRPPVSPSSQALAKVQAVWHHHPEPRKFLAHLGGEEQERCAGVHWLGQSGHVGAADVLVERVLYDNSSAVAATSASALGGMPTEDLLAPLRGGGKLAERQAAFAQQGPPLEERLGAVLLDAPERWHGRPLPSGYDLPLVAEAVARLFASRGSPGLDHVVQALAQSTAWDVRLAAAQALIHSERAAVVGLVELLNGKDAAGQVLAAWVLARRSDEQSLSALAKAMDSSSVLVRRIATLGLVHRGEGRRLVVRVSDPDYVVRCLATEVAVQMGQQLDTLRDALDDPHPEVIRAASAALLMVPDHDHRIAQWTREGSNSMRSLAARLQHLSGPESLERRRDLAFEANAALAERVMATYSLRHGPLAQVLLPLLRLLYDRLPLVRHAAALALKELAPMAAAACLREIAESDRATVVKKTAQQALKATATP